MSLSDIVQSSGWKNFMAKLYGWGASVVIIGALFKINHWPGGALVITIGMAVEAIIFFFSAFEPLQEELDWTLVYPELAGMSDPDEIENFKENVYTPGDRPVEKIENILSTSGVDNVALDKLGHGFTQLGESAAALAEISGATVATKEFVTQMQKAATSIGAIHDTYTTSAESIKESTTSLSSAYFETADSIRKSGAEMATVIQNGQQGITQGSKDYEQQLSILNQNLKQLNSVYEDQIRETAQQMQGSRDLYGGLSDMIANLKASVDETNRYKEEMAKLKDSISSLNSIYGNMLSTMASVKKK